MKQPQARPVSAMNAFQRVAHWLAKKDHGADLNCAGELVKTALSSVSAPATAFIGSLLGNPVSAGATAVAFKIVGDVTARAVHRAADALDKKLNSPKVMPVRTLTRREMALASFA